MDRAKLQKIINFQVEMSILLDLWGWLKSQKYAGNLSIFFLVERFLDVWVKL